MKLAWKRLIRFIATDGKIYHGEPILPREGFDVGLVTSQIVTVAKVLGPLVASDVPILRCVGMNYGKHVKAAGLDPPPYPFIFFKPSLCVTDHGGEIIIPKIVQDGQADYEGELCLVLGKDAKDVPNDPTVALSYVAAYTIGNDVSARKWQRDPALAGRAPQWGFSKGFDTFAPLGPCLVSSELIPNPEYLH